MLNHTTSQAEKNKAKAKVIKDIRNIFRLKKKNRQWH